MNLEWEGTKSGWSEISNKCKFEKLGSGCENWQ
jgi:hypothetical protein